MSDIPPEIITSILQYLPLKSLFGFKCVSKSWNSLISNPTPDFISHNFNHSILQTSKINNQIAIFNDNSSLEAIELNPNKFNTISRFNLPTPPECINDSYHARIVGFCNGIIAVVRCYREAPIFYSFNTCYDLYLWNPFVNDTQFRIPLAELPCKYSSESVFGFGLGLGLGFDSSYEDVKEYKIVRITDFISDGNRKRQAIVYSSKRNCWGLPFVESVDNNFQVGESGVVVNSVVHWIFNEYFQYWLRGFDLISEKWVDDDLPLPNLLGECGFCNLHALNGCLCLMITWDDNGSDVWIMKEYGVKESWAPLFTMSEISILKPLLSISTPPLPIGFSGNGYGHEFLARKRGRYANSQGRFLWINLREETVKEAWGLLPGDVIVCAGSLIRVPNGVPHNLQ